MSYFEINTGSFLGMTDTSKSYRKYQTVDRRGNEEVLRIKPGTRILTMHFIPSAWKILKDRETFSSRRSNVEQAQQELPELIDQLSQTSAEFLQGLTNRKMAYVALRFGFREVIPSNGKRRETKVRVIAPTSDFLEKIQAKVRRS